MLYILISIIVILAVALMGALTLEYLDDESGRSILYDDPEYFDGEQPKWMREEEEKPEDVSCKNCKHFNNGEGDETCEACMQAVYENILAKYEKYGL